MRRGDFAAGPIFFVAPAIAVAVAFPVRLDVAFAFTPRSGAFRVATAVPSTAIGAFSAAATAVFAATATAVFAAAAAMFAAATTVFAAATFAFAFVRGRRRWRRVGELLGRFRSRQRLAGDPGRVCEGERPTGFAHPDALTR